MMGGNYGMGGGFGFGGGFMILWWLIIIVAIVVLAKWLISSYGGGGRRGDADRALDILKERYARGEIDEAEYQKRKSELTK